MKAKVLLAVTEGSVLSPCEAGTASVNSLD